MPPKRSVASATDLHHVTFHFFKSAVLLSVPATTTLADLKAQLLPALAIQPLQAVLPDVETPTSVDDFRIYEDPAEAGGEADGAEAVIGMRCLDEDGQLGRSVRALGWDRWKRLYISFKSPDGTFNDPIYTVPDVEDEGEEQ